ADLAAELRDTHRRLDALDAGDPAANVRAVFSWSYRQLDPPAARLFRLLGLHPGPDITTAAAASLAAAAEPEARRLLAGLTRAHLVIEHARGRFTFHDLLRAYAAEQAREHDSDTDRHAALHRLLDHYLHTAYAASRPVNPARRGISLAAPRPGVEPERFSDSHDALGWLDAEHQVLAAITSHAADSGFDAYAWQLPCMLSRFRARRGYRQQRVESLQVALAAAGRVGDLEAQARVHYELGSACNGIGRHDDGAMHAQRARELYERLGDREGEAAAIGMIGRTFELQGRASEAVEYSQRQLDLYQALGEPVRIAQALNQHGWYCALLGDTRRALDCCEQALVIFRQVGDLAGVAATCDSLGFAHHLAGDLDKAASCYGDAILAFEEVGDLPERARTLVRLGDVHVAAGDRDAARDAWQEALNVFEDLQVPDAAEVRARLGLPDPDGT
ncbi:MAG: tetratricopeptide repeat protein, partial [Actinobacteria bacterium]|nr:tetratricopeptide repeat protein [Actinomycetota bacterium]